MNGDVAETMLKALGELLEEEGFDPVDMLVCGGMAQVLQRFTTRRTTDIDSLGFVENTEGRPRLLKPIFDVPLRMAIERVGTVHGKGKNWLNSGAISLHDTELPEGLVERASTRHYGESLTIRLCSRPDLVTLKMWAAYSRSGPDLDDLKEMSVTEEEVAASSGA